MIDLRPALGRSFVISMILLQAGCGTALTPTADQLAPVAGSPKLVQVDAPTISTMVLAFNEPVGASALDPNNYMIVQLGDGTAQSVPDLDTIENARAAAQAGLSLLAIISAERGANDATIILTTAEQKIGHSYRVMVLDVRDIAGEPVDGSEDTLDVMFAGTSGLTDDDLPRVVAAGSTSNTTVMVSFTKMMGDSAIDPDAYSIVQSNIVPEAGTLNIVDAQFLGGDRTAVELTTLAQSTVQYEITAVHVTDLAGNSLAPREAIGSVLIDSTKAIFWGSGVACPEAAGTCANFAPARGLGTDGDGACRADIDCNGGSCDQVAVCINADFETAGNACSSDDECCNEGEDCPEGICEAQPGTCDNFSASIGAGIDGQGGCSRDDDCCTSGQSCSGTCEVTPCELPDEDGDGLTDDLEQRGWVVHIVKSSGEIVSKDVTSDPFVRDSDGDGLDDFQEHRRCTDPRNADTDGDTIADKIELFTHFTSMSNQDTDTDGINDWSELDFFETSPILADTDGDGFRDNIELFQMNRNPRLADLPNSQILIGTVALRLDTRFTYTDTQGVSRTSEETVQTELTRSSSQTLSTSDQSSYQNVINTKVGIKHESGGSAGVGQSGSSPVSVGAQSKTTYSGEAGYEHAWGYTYTNTRESTEASQQAYNESLTTSETIDQTQAVTREVLGASIEVTVNLLNLGDTAFTIRNLELTALQQDRSDRTKFTPIATLVPSSTLDTGDALVVNLGPLTIERGPFVFKSREVFPSLVEDLMKNPRGLMFRVANLDIEDEAGRNFAFASQEINDRTAGITVDNGAGRVDRYRVATASTFDDDGKAVGITMRTALQDIIGLSKNPEFDAITSGADGCGQTIAAGDDVQLFTPVCYEIIRRDDVIVTAGLNGIIDSEPRGDDFFDVMGVCTDDPSSVCSEHPAHRVICPNQLDCKDIVNEVIRDGGDGCAHTSPFRDDQAAVLLDNAGNIERVQQSDCEPGGDNGELILAGPNGVLDSQPMGDDEASTLGGYATEVFSQCDVNSPGVRVGAACETDADCQSPSFPDAMCRRTEGMVRLGGVGNQSTFRCAGDSPPGAIGALCGASAEFELPEDAEECGGGTCTEVVDRLWLIQIKGDFDHGADFDDLVLQAGDAYFLTYIQDKDADGLTAREEFLYGSSDVPPRGENSDGCFRAQCGPCDAFDSLSDFDEVRRGWEVKVEGRPTYRTYGDPVVPDADGDGLFDDQEMRFGTDALVRDTDQDGISDFDEVFGFTIYEPDRTTVVKHISPYQYGEAIVAGYTGSAIVEPSSGGNGTIDTEPRLDDEFAQDNFELGTEVSAGTKIILPGDNGIIDSIPCGDDREEKVKARTSASGDDIQVVEPNTLVAAGEPVVLPGPNGRLDSSATSPDFERREGLVYHRDRFATDPLNRDTDGDSLLDGVERDLGHIGSDPNDGADPNDPSDASEFRDDDRDGLANREETDGWNRGVWRTVTGTGAQEFCCTTNTGTVLGATCGNPGGGPGCTVVTSDPLEPDTDHDGLPDSLEQILGSDPRERDTDQDGLLDYDEFDGESRFSIAIGDFRDFEDVCFDADRCEYDDENSVKYGTSPSIRDTDADSRTDYEEIFIEWVVAPCSLEGSDVVDVEPEAVFSDPTDADFDNDELSDGQELAAGTNPNDFDTDSDGKKDGTDEYPLGCDNFNLTMTFTSHTVGADNCEPGAHGEFHYYLQVLVNGSAAYSVSHDQDDVDDMETVALGFSTPLIAVNPGDVIEVRGFILECDSQCNLTSGGSNFDCGGDTDEPWGFRSGHSSRTWVFGETLPLDQPFEFGPNSSDRGCENDGGYAPCFSDDRVKMTATASEGF
jgi:hypothetical protein